MIKGIHTYIKDNKGQTIVEFALIVALLLAILFGIIEFGRAWFYSNHLTNSVRATARYAAVLGVFNHTAVDTYLRDEIGSFMNADDIGSINIAATAPDGTVRGSDFAVTGGDTINVTVEYNFTVLSGSIIPWFRGNYVLKRSASMRFEGL